MSLIKAVNFAIDDIKVYSAHSEGKSVVAERFIRTLKNKIYKYMSSISKNVYIYKLNDIVNEYNNTYHITIKMKPVNVQSSTYIVFVVENNKKVDAHVKISKHKNILQKVTLQIGPEKVL